VSAAIVTGAGGLIGAECARELVRAGFDLRPFQARYPDWQVRHGIESILREIHDRNTDRWLPACAAAA